MTEQITAVMETITPEKATEYLAKNVDHNRMTRDWKVNRYALAMQEGRWVPTSATIKFDKNGALIDGQHRLKAVVEANMAVRMMVAHGEDPKAIYVTDMGTPRTASDTLVVAGLASRTSGSQMAGLANALNGYQMGLYSHAMDDLANADRLAPDEIVEYVRKYNALLEVALGKANEVLRMVPLNRSGLAVAYIVLSAIDQAGADDFFHRLGEGILNGSTDPLTVLTRKATAERLQPHRRSPVGATLYLVFRTWNAWRQGESFRTFQYGSKATGWTQIPKPI